MTIASLLASFFFGATIAAVWEGHRAVGRSFRAGYRLGRRMERAETAARAGNDDQGQGGHA